LYERQKTNDLSALLHSYANEEGLNTYSIDAIIIDNSKVGDYEPIDGWGAKYHTLDAILKMVQAIEGVGVAL
jgi:hypothetical protein